MRRRHLFGMLSFAATIFTVGHVLALAKTYPGEPELDGDAGMTHGYAVPSDEPLSTGRVVAVDPAAGRVTLEYRPIPRLFLDGGTRVFHIKEPVSLDGLRPGDRVRFEVERDARSYTIIRIENSN